jgi:hypothetical protein
VYQFFENMFSERTKQVSSIFSFNYNTTEFFGWRAHSAVYSGVSCYGDISREMSEILVVVVTSADKLLKLMRMTVEFHATQQYTAFDISTPFSLNS